MVIATSARTPSPRSIRSSSSPNRVSFTSNGSGSNGDDDYETDTSILNRSPIRRVKSVDNQKDEMAYCNNLACILSKATDLPKLCQGFPSVVATVVHHNAEYQQQAQQQQQQQLYRASSMGTMNTYVNNNSGFILPPPSDR